jgi:hypothetical protein
VLQVKERKELKEILVLKDPKVIRVILEHKERKVILVLRDLKVIREHRVFLVLEFLLEELKVKY